MKTVVDIELAKRLKVMGYSQQKDDENNPPSKAVFIPAFLDVVEWLHQKHNTLLWVAPFIVSDDEIEWCANIYDLDSWPVSISTSRLYDTYIRGINLALDKIEEKTKQSF